MNLLKKKKNYYWFDILTLFFSSPSFLVYYLTKHQQQQIKNSGNIKIYFTFKYIKHSSKCDHHLLWKKKKQVVESTSIFL